MTTPNTPRVPDDLYELCEFILTAQDDFTEADWEAFATSDDAVKREVAAMSYLCPLHWLVRLSDDSVRSVQMAALANPGLPGACVDSFALDPSPKAQYLVARHPNASVESLQYLAEHGTENIKEGLATNPGTPVSILRTLAADENRRVRFGLLYNHSLPDDCMMTLASDEDPEINQIAFAALQGGFWRTMKE